MINSMTVVLCNKLCAFGIFPKSQEKIYIYGFELLLSSVIGIMVLMMISITRGTAFAWLSYLLGFIPVRITGGGYHAKTHFTCILSFSLLFLIFLLSSSFIDIQSITYIFLSLTTLIISLAVIRLPCSVSFWDFLSPAVIFQILAALMGAMEMERSMQ